MAVPIYIPINSAQGFPFLHILTNIDIFCLFNVRFVRWYLIVVLICISLMISDVEHFFISRHTCFIALHFIVLHRCCVFYKLKVYRNPESTKCISDIFPRVFDRFVSLCPILLIFCNILNFFIIIIFLMVISDLWCYCCKKMMTCWRLRWWLAFFFSNKVFLN